VSATAFAGKTIKPIKAWSLKRIGLNDWMGGERTYRAREEVVGLGQYGRTLTVLTCAGLSAEKESEYDDEESKLIESWTPRFRR
jgi:hypothetical protein